MNFLPCRTGSSTATPRGTNGPGSCTELIEGDKGTFELTETGSLFYPEADSDVKWADKAQRDEEEKNAIIITSGGTLEASNLKKKNAKPKAVSSMASTASLVSKALPSIASTWIASPTKTPST